MKKIILFLIVLFSFVSSNQNVFALPKIIRSSILNNTTFYDFCSDPDYPETYSDPGCVQYRSDLDQLEKQNAEANSNQTSGESSSGSNSNVVGEANSNQTSGESSSGSNSNVVGEGTAANGFSGAKAFEPQLIEVATKAEVHRSSYEKIASETGVPWQLLAAIHFRENSYSLKNSVTYGKNGVAVGCQGLFGFYSKQSCVRFPPGTVSTAGLEEQLRFLVSVLKNDYGNNVLGSSPLNNEGLMDLLYSYNGRTPYQNRTIVLNNCPELAGSNLPNYKLSAYVMSGFNDCFVHLMKPSRDNGVADTVDKIPGVMTIYQYLLSRK